VNVPAKRLFRHRFFWGAFSGCIATFVIAGSPLLQNLQLSMLSWHYQIANQIQKWTAKANSQGPITSKEISLVKFDDNSQFDLGIARFNDAHSQKILASAIEEIERCKPVIVVLDLDLRGALSLDLLKVMRRYRNIVVALFGSLEASTELPAPEYLSHAAAFGYSEIPYELNGAMYQLPINYVDMMATPGASLDKSQMTTVPSLTEAIINLNRQIRGVGPDMQFLAHQADEPLYLSYRRQAYPEMSLQNVLKQKFDAKQFRDRIVMIGYAFTIRSAGGTNSNFGIISSKESLKQKQSKLDRSDMFVHAEAVSTLLEHEQISAVPPLVARVFVLFLGALFGGLSAILKPANRIATYLALCLGLLLLGQLCFQGMHLLLPIVPPLAVLTIAYCLGSFIHLDANLQERNRELAQARKSMQLRSEEERQRIAEDLHDETLPALSQVARLADKLNLELVDNPIPNEMRQSLDFSVAEMRRVINDLHPSVLETMGFKPALENLLAMLAHDTVIKTHFSESGEFSEKELDKFKRLQLYRIAQEALNNVRKHSEAKDVELKIIRSGNMLILSIIDDGKGMQVKQDIGHSHGMLNIKQRAQLIGATVAWQKPGQYLTGTEVKIDLSLGNEEEIG
jgi:signal transduction histidine kinase